MARATSSNARFMGGTGTDCGSRPVGTGRGRRASRIFGSSSEASVNCGPARALSCTVKVAVAPGLAEGLGDSHEVPIPVQFQAQHRDPGTRSSRRPGPSAGLRLPGRRTISMPVIVLRLCPCPFTKICRCRAGRGSGPGRSSCRPRSPGDRAASHSGTGASSWRVTGFRHLGSPGGSARRVNPVFLAISETIDETLADRKSSATIVGRVSLRPSISSRSNAARARSSRSLESAASSARGHGRVRRGSPPRRSPFRVRRIAARPGARRRPSGRPVRATPSRPGRA